MPSIRNLPQLAEDIALQTRSGNLVVGVDRYSGPDGRRLQNWVDDVVFAGLGVFGFLSSAGPLIGAVLASGPPAAYLGRSVVLVLSLGMTMRTAARIPAATGLRRPTEWWPYACARDRPIRSRSSHESRACYYLSESGSSQGW